MKSLMATVVALAALFLSGCGQPVRLDATSLGSQPDEIAVLKCDPDSYCRVSVKRLQDGQYLTVEHYGSSHRRDVWLDEIRLDPGLYQISAQVCYSGLPPSIAGEPVYKLLIFEALPGHDYDIVIKKPNYGYCKGGVSIEDRIMGQIVARWCHPKRIREYPEECEPVSDEWDISEYKKRADAGDPYAMFTYANSLPVGEGLERLQWYCRTAHAGHAKARYQLGRYYEHGWVIERDSIQAYSWYTLSSKAGYAHGSRMRLSQDMTADQIAEAERLVAEWEPNPTECKIYSDETHAP